ncbi:MAG: response regulator transcription factor [Actinobacteria bacterium]|nr:response regulator transcription factor [Actinomycetota bacterium]
MMERKIKVAIIDDHAIVLEGLTKLFNSKQEFEVVFATTDGRQASEVASSLEIDILVLDVRIPGLDTSRLIRYLKEKKPELKILCLSSFDSPYEIAELLNSGAHGYIVKSASTEEILNATQRILSDGLYIDPQLKIFDFPQKVSEILQKKLTQRETEIARLIVKGLSNKEISRLLQISESTVKTHIKKIMEKLNVRNRAELATEVLRDGLVRESD